MAFSLYERHYLGIHGLLPPAFMTEEQQAYRVMTKLREQPDDLAKLVDFSAFLPFPLVSVSKNNNIL